MECDHMIKFFDATLERRLYFSDFLQVLLPCDQNVLRADASQRQTYEVQPQQSLQFDVEKLLSKLIHKELRFAKQQEYLKQQLAQSPEYNLQKFFEAIDNQFTRIIDQVNLKRFLIKCSFLPNDNLLLAIIRRIDLDCDAKLNYLEFCDAIRPLEDHVSVLKRTINREKENFIQQR